MSTFTVRFSKVFFSDKEKRLNYHTVTASKISQPNPTSSSIPSWRDDQFLRLSPLCMQVSPRSWRWQHSVSVPATPCPKFLTLRPWIGSSPFALPSSFPPWLSLRLSTTFPHCRPTGSCGRQRRWKQRLKRQRLRLQLQLRLQLRGMMERSPQWVWHTFSCIDKSLYNTITKGFLYNTQTYFCLFLI